jgi:hypothetical protein
VQALVSDYERGKVRLNGDVILRFGLALEVSTDALLRTIDTFLEGAAAQTARRA